MLDIKISKQDYRNLVLFLQRVNLTGKEVMAYVNIMNAINEAKSLENTMVSEDDKEVD